jgi:nucleotide-binding universal stress UspA family protein
MASPPRAIPPVAAAVLAALRPRSGDEALATAARAADLVVVGSRGPHGRDRS